MELLEVGDVILKRHYGFISYVGKIDRVTKTSAFSGGARFKREISGRSVYPVPRSSFSSAWHYKATEQDLSDFKKQDTIRFVSNFKYSTLSYEKICEINEIIKRKDD